MMTFKDVIRITMLSIFLVICMLLLLILTAIEAFAYEYTPSDIVYIGQLVEHEAPNESELGKRLVIDTVLNRVDSPDFPNSVTEVISQPGQYCIPKKYPPKEVYTLVAEEIYNRTNSRVLWFKTKKYHTYGIPIIQEGSHYFSGR